jgi:hypothetical protein
MFHLTDIARSDVQISEHSGGAKIGRDNRAADLARFHHLPGVLPVSATALAPGRLLAHG